VNPTFIAANLHLDTKSEDFFVVTMADQNICIIAALSKPAI